MVTPVIAGSRLAAGDIERLDHFAIAHAMKQDQAVADDDRTAQQIHPNLRTREPARHDTLATQCLISASSLSY